uniref:Uncharacterized protein n=1 Tax=Haptolina ericina TaxID=156174 RepID=A0A7S3EUH3_9EUKA
MRIGPLAASSAKEVDADGETVGRMIFLDCPMPPKAHFESAVGTGVTSANLTLDVIFAAPRVAEKTLSFEGFEGNDIVLASLPSSEGEMLTAGAETAANSTWISVKRQGGDGTVEDLAYAHASLSVSELSAAGDVTAGGNIATGGAGKVTTNQVLAQSIGVGTTDPKSAVHISGGNGMIRLTGRSTDYINAGVVLEATNSNGARGLGVFMHDKGGKTEWYAGTPYANSDSYVIARTSSTDAHSTATAQQKHALMTLTNGGKLSAHHVQATDELSVTGHMATTGYSTQTIEFSTFFTSGKTHTVASLSSYSTGTVAVASIEYVGLYAYAGSNLAGGSRIAVTRRINSNSAWGQHENDDAKVGDTFMHPPFKWTNGVLTLQTAGSVQITARVRITAHAATITRNYRAA